MFLSIIFHCSYFPMLLPYITDFELNMKMDWRSSAPHSNYKQYVRRKKYTNKNTMYLLQCEGEEKSTSDEPLGTKCIA
jgi:hypothetical protein